MSGIEVAVALIPAVISGVNFLVGLFGGGGMSMEEHRRKLEVQIGKLRVTLDMQGRELNREVNRLKDENAQKNLEVQRQEFKRLECQERALTLQLSDMESQYRTLQIAEENRSKQFELLREYPKPSFLESYSAARNVNIGIAGSSGVGKSLLNNRLRGLTEDNANGRATGVERRGPGASRVGNGAVTDGCSTELGSGAVASRQNWAATGETETTLNAIPYELPGNPDVNLWDLPGVGTRRFPLRTYFKDIGLKYFHALIIVCRSRFTQNDIDLATECERLGLPVYFVRSHMDVAVVNEWEDNELSPLETVQKIRSYIRQQGGIENVYCLALKDSHMGNSGYAGSSVANTADGIVAQAKQYFDAEFSRLTIAIRMAIDSFQGGNAISLGGA